MILCSSLLKALEKFFRYYGTTFYAQYLHPCLSAEHQRAVEQFDYLRGIPLADLIAAKTNWKLVSSLEQKIWRNSSLAVPYGGRQEMVQQPIAQSLAGYCVGLHTTGEEKEILKSAVKELYNITCY